MSTLVVITGPIASGKSTIAGRLATEILDRGQTAAVADLDEVVFAQRAPWDEFERSWERGRAVHGALVGAWLRVGIDVVIAEGPFYTADELAPLLAGVPAGVAPRHVTLLTSYDVALERVTADPTRIFSKDPTFLRQTHERFHELLSQLPPAEWTFDTTSMPVDEIVDALVEDLVRS